LGSQLSLTFNQLNSLLILVIIFKLRLNDFFDRFFGFEVSHGGDKVDVIVLFGHV
jgi:hypothetical protein